MQYFAQVLNAALRELKDSQRVLISLKYNKLQLKLTVKARLFEAKRKATYVFELLPVSVDRIDILESKLPDVEAQQSLKPRAHDWLFLESRAELSSFSSNILWNELEANNFRVEEDGTAIEWLVQGVFSISVVVNHSPTSSHGSIGLYKGGERIQFIPVGCVANERVLRNIPAIVQTSTTLICITSMQQGDKISISCTGTSPTAPAYLTAVRISQ